MAVSKTERAGRWLHIIEDGPDHRGLSRTRCETRIRDREPNTGKLCPHCAWWLRIMNTHAERRLNSAR